MSTPGITLWPDPSYMDWKPWAEVVSGYNPALVGVCDPEEGWEEFAERICTTLPQVPRPTGFPDWRDWASAAKLVLGA